MATCTLHTLASQARAHPELPGLGGYRGAPCIRTDCCMAPRSSQRMSLQGRTRVTHKHELATPKLPIASRQRQADDRLWCSRPEAVVSERPLCRALETEL